MLQDIGARLDHELRGLAKEMGGDRRALIPLLQEVQRRHGYISEHAMQIVADELGLHPVEVHSVLSFYSFLSTKPKGRFIIRLCRTISCDMAGKDRVARQLENDLGIKFGQTTTDGKFTLEYTNCIGMCDQGPALLVNDKVYTQVSAEKVNEIIEECRSAFGAHALQQKEGH